MMLKQLFAVAFYSDLKAIRFTLALGAIFIGLGFLWPVQVFPTAAQIAAGSGRHTYVLMANIAPQWAWGAAFLFQGTVMMWSLLHDKCSKTLFWADAVLGVILWTVAISACYLAYWQGLENIMRYRPPAIMGGEAAAVCASWWILVRYNTDEARDCNG